MMHINNILHLFRAGLIFTLCISNFFIVFFFICVLALGPLENAYGAGPFDIVPGEALPTKEDLLARGCRQQEILSADKFPQIPGVETTIRVFQCGERSFALYELQNLKCYAVASKQKGQPLEACIDEDSLGYCTRTVQEDEEFLIDFAAYGVKTQETRTYDTKILELPQVQRPPALTSPQLSSSSAQQGAVQ